MVLLLHVQQKRSGWQNVLQMSPDKVTHKVGDFGRHMGLKLAYVSTRWPAFSKACTKTNSRKRFAQFVLFLNGCFLFTEQPHNCCLQ